VLIAFLKQHGSYKQLLQSPMTAEGGLSKVPGECAQIIKRFDQKVINSSHAALEQLLHTIATGLRNFLENSETSF
jgi:hypothetical protein